MRHENTTGEKGGNLINLSEEIGFLKERLYVELLTSNENNKNAIEEFVANDNGKPLEEFLKNKAWEQDLNNEIRVYLVKDRMTGEILFYFALKTGLLFESITTKFGKLTEVEQEIVNTYIDIYLDPKAEDDPEVVFDWYEGIQINVAKVWDSIELQLDVKNEIKIDSESAKDSINTMQVSETFPGLVITHFCKNVNTSFNKEFSFPLGFYVFGKL